MATNNNLESKKEEWKEQIAENIDKGESVFSVYKGEALQRLSGRMTDQEALALGHFDGLTNITLNVIKTTEDGLNELSSLPPDLVPMVKRVKKKDMKESDLENIYKKGMIWVTLKEEAEIMAKQEGLKYKLVEGKYFYEYPGLVIKSTLMTDFVHNIARASGSLQGETKKGGFEAVSNIKAVPIFPQMPGYRPTPEMYGQDYKDQDAD